MVTVLYILQNLPDLKEVSRVRMWIFREEKVAVESKEIEPEIDPGDLPQDF